MEKIKGGEKMEEKEVANVRKITGELIGGIILFGILFSILTSFLCSRIFNILGQKAWTMVLILDIIIVDISIFCVYKCSTVVTFKKRSIYYTDVSAVIKNILVYTIVICTLSILSTCMNTINEISNIEKEVNSDIKIKFQEKMIQSIYSDAEITKYQREKQEMIEELKTQIISISIISEIATIAIYFGIIPIEKKWILKHAISDT